MPQDKINAYMTLYTALVVTAKISAPMIPFMAEDIYRNLVCSVDPHAPESVHLCQFPACEEDRILPELEEEMEEVLRIVVSGRAARAGSGRKNRQPLAKMFVRCETPLKEDCAAIVREELNVKEIVFTDEVEEYLSWSFKPQLKTCGPKFGKQLGAIRAALPTLDGAKAKKELDEEGSLALDLPDGRIVLSPEDLIVQPEQKEGFFAVSDAAITVVLDTALTEELITEGFVREIISKVQTMRKDADFNVTDRIEIGMSGNDRLFALAMANQEEICGDTLAVGIFAETAEGAKEWDINGEAVTLSVKVISR
jgi:isoleucyl-tRNA synthetase